MSWMLIASAIALAGVLPGELSEAEAEAIETATEEPLIDTIELANERYRRMTVPVTIMGQGPFDFMLDTGAQATVLSIDLADHLELNDREQATLIGMASSRQVETTIVPQLGLGSRTFNIRTAAIVEGAHIGGADGILGLDSLQNQRVLLDFANSQILIADADELGGNSGFEIVVRARERLGQLIIHRAEIDGIRVAVIIDTGAQGSVGNPELRERLRRARRRDDAVMTDVNGVQITGETVISERLVIGGMELRNVSIAFADSPTFRSLGLGERPAMILGMSELRMFDRVAIDFRSARVLFDMPGGTRIEDRWKFGGFASRLDQ